MTVVRRSLLAAVASVSLLAGCGESSVSPTTPEESAVESPTPASPPTLPSPQVLEATADLAAFLGVDQVDIEVGPVEEVTWRDGSRGCAEPGMNYTQALIDGSRITLRVDGTDYEYHSGGSQPAARCENPTE